MKNIVLLLMTIGLIAFGCQNNKTKTNETTQSSNTIQQQILAAESLTDCPTAKTMFQSILIEAEKKLSPQDTLLATLHHDIAAACINGCGTFDEAIAEGQRAFEMRQTQLGNAHILTARSGHLVAKAWIGKNQLQKALFIYDQITAYHSPQNAQDSADLADIYGSIARVYVNLGDPEHTADYAQQAINFFTNKGFPENKAFYINDLANAQIKSANIEEALQTYQKALQAFAYADSIDPKNKAFWQAGTPSCWHNMGIAERDNHHFDAAATFFQKALTAFVQQKDSINAAETRIEQAKLFLEMHQFAAAETAARASLSARQRLLPPYHPDIVEAFTVLGNIKAAQGQSVVANDFYNKACQAIGDFRALEIIEPLMRRAEGLAQSPSPDYIGTGQYPNQLDKAFEACVIADSILTETRQLFQSNSTKTDFAQRTAAFYEKAVGVATTLYNQRHTPQYLDAAARFISRNKAQNWFDNFHDKRAKRFGGIPDADLQREQALKSEWAYLEKAKADADTAQQRNLDNQIFKLQTDLTLLKKHFEKDYPRYFDLKYAADAPLSIANLQQHLDDSTAVIEYYLGEKSLFTMAFDRHRAHLFQQAITPLFQQTFKNLRRSLTDETWLTDSTHAAQAQFQEAAYTAFTYLLKKPLDNCPTARRLRIVPDGRLGYVPYDVLLEKPTTADWQEPSHIPYLLNKYAISEAFALRQIGFDAPSSVPALNFAGFGIEYADKPADVTTALEPSADDGLLNATRSSKMGRLRFAATEVKAIQQLLKTGSIWLNKDAQKQAFMDNAPRAGILHLAMHGFSDEKQPLNSGLVFSKNPHDTTKNAEILRGYDIYNLPLQAHLAVLSACHTGDGELQHGEGVMSLARTFSMAGCASEIMSLWSIPDKTTSDIMTNFYVFWHNGLPKDIALQQAKQAYLKQTTPQFATPNYWAATVIIGDLSSIEPTNRHDLRWWLGSLLVAIGVLIFLLLVYQQVRNRIFSRR